MHAVGKRVLMRNYIRWASLKFVGVEVKLRQISTQRVRIVDLGVGTTHDAKSIATPTMRVMFIILSALTGTTTALILPQHAPQHVRARPVHMVATFAEELNAQAAMKTTASQMLNTLKLDALRDRLEGKLSESQRAARNRPSEFTQMCHERSIETAQRNALGVLPHSFY